MRILYFDCFNGASGDMVLAASGDDGRPMLLAVDGDAAAGTKIR